MRAVGRIAATVIVAGAVAAVPAQPALAATRLLISSHDGRCLDADIATPTHNGTKVQTWQCIAGGRNQQWVGFADGTVKSSWDGRCLDADIAGGTRNGTKVQLWDCNGWLNQKWTFHTDGSIRSRHDGRCLDQNIAGGVFNGTKAQLWDCNGWLNQRWHG